MNNKLWFLFLLGACGGGDGAGGLSVDVENPSAFCRAVAETGCSTMYACLTDAERMAKHLPMTEAECERQLESGCEDVVDSCNDNTHGYASEVAGACINEMNAATCNDAGEPWLDAPSCDHICAVTKGAFELKWVFSPSSYSCSQLNVATVGIYSTAADGRTYVDTYDCYTGQGVTDVLPVGNYSVHLELFNASNQRLWAGLSAAGKLDRELVDLVTLMIPVAQQ